MTKSVFSSLKFNNWKHLLKIRIIMSPHYFEDCTLESSNKSSSISHSFKSSRPVNRVNTGYAISQQMNLLFKFILIAVFN